MIDIQAVSASRGLDWVSKGFGLFRRNALIWIAMLIIFLTLTTLLSLVPFVGSIAALMLQPVLVGGMQSGCRALGKGEELRIEHLFDGFHENTKQLALVGLYAALGYLLIGLLIALAVGSSVLSLEFLDRIGDLPDLIVGSAFFGMLIAALFGMLLAVPIAMATWFAPTLIVLHNLPALSAMKLSFAGCLRNMLPFLIYGLIVLLLGFVAMIPAGLGLLVLGPTLVGSVYAGYQDIFSQRIEPPRDGT